MKLKLLASVAFLLSAHQSFAMQPEDLDRVPSAVMKKSEARVYSTEELGRSLYATHITSEFPMDFVMKAHRVVRLNVYMDAYHVNEDNPRGGNFWALGAPIHNHSGANFDSYRYGVVLPFQELYPQLLNVCPADTYTFGDFDLKRAQNVHVFVPKDEVIEDPKTSNLTLHSYEGDLRDSIQAFLSREAQAWQVTLHEAQGQFSYYDKALLEGRNINTPSFFQSLLTDKPHVSYGKESISHVPRQGILSQMRFLTDINDLVRKRMESSQGEDLLTLYNIEPYVILANMADANLREIFEVQKTHPLSEFAGPLLRQLGKNRKYLEALSADLKFRLRFGFLASDLLEKHLKNLSKCKVGQMRLVNSPKGLDKFLENIRTKNYDPRCGAGQSGEKSIDNFRIIGEYLVSFPEEFVLRYLSAPGMEKRAPLYENLYWLNRFIRWDYECAFEGQDSSQSKDFKRFQSTLEGVESYVKRYGQDVNFLFYLDALVMPMDRGVTTEQAINNRLKALTEPRLWKLLKKAPQFEIEFVNNTRVVDIKKSLENCTRTESNGTSLITRMDWDYSNIPVRRVKFSNPFID